MIIRKPFDSYVPISSNPGSAEYDNYSLNIAEDGRKSLVKTGVVNLHQRIQSYKDGCDIYKLLANGSMVLPEVVMAPGVLDSTRLPKNIFEANALVNTCKSYYKSLPDEVKTDVSYTDFIKSFGSTAVRDRVANTLQKIKEKEIVNNES